MLGCQSGPQEGRTGLRRCLQRPSPRPAARPPTLPVAENVKPGAHRPLASDLPTCNLDSLSLFSPDHNLKPSCDAPLLLVFIPSFRPLNPRLFPLLLLDSRRASAAALWAHVSYCELKCETLGGRPDSIVLSDTQLLALDAGEVATRNEFSRDYLVRFSGDLCLSACPGG